jgi:hypothetical protein
MTSFRQAFAKQNVRSGDAPAGQNRELLLAEKGLAWPRGANIERRFLRSSSLEELKRHGFSSPLQPGLAPTPRILSCCSNWPRQMAIRLPWGVVRRGPVVMVMVMVIVKLASVRLSPTATSHQPPALASRRVLAGRASLLYAPGWQIDAFRAGSGSIYEVLCTCLSTIVIRVQAAGPVLGALGARPGSRAVAQ